MTQRMSITLTILSISLMSALVACGRQETKNSTHLGRAKTSGPTTTTPETTAPPVSSADDNNRTATPSSTNLPDSMPASASCVAPFTDVVVPENEREIKWDDLASSSAAQWPENTSEEISLELAQVETWTNTTDLDSKEVEQLSGLHKATAGYDIQRVICYTKTLGGDLQPMQVIDVVPSQIDLQQKKLVETLTLQLDAGQGRMGAKISRTSSASNLSEISFSKSGLTQVESVLSRQGDRDVVLRVKTVNLSEDGKKQQESLILARYRLVDQGIEDTSEMESDSAEASDSLHKAH